MKTTLDELQTLIAIADFKSITKAAERLEQTTSGVSKILLRLEKKLGVTLLRRTTRKIDLTPEGESFLIQAREIVAAMEAAEESVQSKNKKPSGILRVDSAAPFILHAIAPYIKEFTELYPQINIELFSNDRTIDLLEKRVDVAIRIGKLEDSTMHAIFLGQSKRRFFASPEYLKEFGTPKSIEDLSDHRLIGFTDPRHLNNWPLKNLSKPLHFQFMASSGETVLRLVNEGVGIACLSDFMTKDDRKKGKLVQILAGQTIDQREQIHAIYFKNALLSSRMNVFIQFLKSKMKAIVD